ncbi:MAG TPA: AAA family ATPase [Longimicrobium sp.]|nr:AAA family ATPase [Longimicrobium sp.]
MNDTLPISSFEIEGYRGIRHLRLPELGRVNLFVGLNNTGKTSLLEAAQLYASRTPKSVLASILRQRSGLRPRFASSRNRDVGPEQIGAAVNSVRSLFYGAFSGHGGKPIRIGLIDGEGGSLTISVPWLAGLPADYEDSELEVYLELDSVLLEIAHRGTIASLTVDWFLRRFGVILTGTSRSTALIPAQGLDAIRISEMWDQAASAGYAPEVEQALRTIVPELERVYLLGEPGSGTRTVAMQLHGTPRPMPLPAMGDGTNRVFGLALSCVRARGGVLLVDEVENGLHHSVQRDVWDSMFSLSERLNVQIFATTHSWDAVVGFQHAANRSVVKGMLYRLEREEDGGVYAERYTEKDVAVAAEQQVEVR